MKKCLSLPLIIALALLVTFIYVGCGAKEIPPATTTTTAEAPPVQEAREMDELPQSAEETAEHESTEEHESAEEHQNMSLRKKHQNTNPQRNGRT